MMDFPPQPYAMQEKRPISDQNTRLVVNNLPYTVTEYDLSKFRDFGYCTITIKK
jgi:RNA recognition motif-containing protein